jgi:CDP-6-deoxy-D-xylo-4-hexulose-3-dehydrase
LGSLPYGYDHKYIYSHIGYNLKVTDMQAAVGVAQLKKLPEFIEARKRNWGLIYEGLKKYEDYFILPKATDNSDPSWFGFLLTVKEDAPFSRNEITNYLEKNKIATRLLFSGNIIRHPSFENVKYRVYNNLRNTDFIMNNAFWIGVYPGLTEEMIDYELKKFDEFLGDEPK